ncbi:NAD(P)-binding protein [Aulographum hederae CBS 113979]|uniref:NAD(P)-binding protein n=1 Tax=Aulographum hederae CBS 113979 TaxID=1176131 RepID=A0A6G1GWB6_9PEZI|nr:NAD(P)-binding protein [Aulographum hederae CBS 113979]
MSSPTKILVLGAGELGLAVLRAFASSEHSSSAKITVLLRPSTAELPSSHPKVAPIYALKTVDIVPCDLVSGEQSELAAVFKNFDVVIGCTGSDASSRGSGEGFQVKLAKAVLEAESVGLYVPWQFGLDYDAIGRGSDQDLFDEQLNVRDILRDAKKNGATTDWIIVSVGMFSKLLSESWFGIVEKDQEHGQWIVNAFGSWEHAITVTAEEDIGNMTAAIVFAALSSDDGLRNSVVFVAGDTFTYAELFDVVNRVSNGQAKKGREWTISEMKSDVEADPENMTKKYRWVWADGVGIGWPKETTFNGTRGLDLVDVTGLAKRSLTP